MIPSAVFHVAVAQQNKIPLSNKFSRNLGNMPKTYTHVLSTSGKYMTGFLVKSFGECCRSSLWCWRPSVTGRQVTVFLLTIGVGGVKLQPFTVVLNSDKGVYCRHSSSYSISGSRNYIPQAKSDPRSHFIWPQNTFCQYEKIIYSQKMCWFGGMQHIPKQSHYFRCPALEPLCNGLCGPLPKNVETYELDRTRVSQTGPSPPFGANGAILWGPRLEAFTR